QGDGGDDLGHHQRLVDHHIDEGLPAEAAAPRGPQRRHGGRGGGDQRGRGGDDQRADRGFLHRGVGPGGLVPAEGEPAPAGDRVGPVEGIADQRDDRGVERDEGGGRDGGEAGQ